MTSRLVGDIAAAVACLVTCLTTVIWPNWIEIAFRVDPDRGSGTVEWAIVFATLALAIAASVAARSQWRRAHTARL